MAYTETGRNKLGSGGLGRSNLASSTHVVRVDGTGDQVVSDMFVVQWLGDSKRVGTARDGLAAISDREGNIVGEFGTPSGGPPTQLDHSWIQGAANGMDARMPHTKHLDRSNFGDYGEDAAFSPNGVWFGPLTVAGGCEFLNANGQTMTIPLKEGDQMRGQAVWSPEGRYVACWRGNGMTVLDMQEKRVVAANLRIEAKMGSSFDFRKARWDPWSRDGKHLVLVRDGQVWTCAPDGTATRQLTFDATQKGWPTFSRDGKRLAYVTWLDNKRVSYQGEQSCSNLWIVDVDSTLAVRVTATAPGTICSLDWLTDQTVIFDRLTRASWSDTGTLQTISLMEK